ncbi:MAG: Lrp/AsnC family transcriptional regulator [Candidatus Woesearchaeota archaeon]
MENPIKLTENEKKVLKKLICDSRMNDTKIAESNSISQQAVYQIRNRLESLGIIEGYCPIINFKKIGLNIMYIIGIEILPYMWEEFKEHEITEKLKDLPFVLKLIRLPSTDVSYIAILGFKDIKDRELFSSKIESKFSKKINIVWSYTTYSENYMGKNKLSSIDYALNKNELDFDKIIDKINKK